MRKASFTDSQIMAVLKRTKGGEAVPAMCRETGSRAATFLKKMYLDERLKAEVFAEAITKKC
ncbi:MAG: hypothetical protein ING77_03035 [Rhodocyclaceae bacterium]|nr:hypothetical protein [Rhodocyclaceae bacterium]MCA3075883.1 hypothetical protein [Rhodocyclaceae bacterium]MCA3092039.1 hypothetical protein [Rhodocyclaceae bacterium]MCA3095837.1 hypothetical protein [Rhodocyclaceae bacterium]MCA3096443.1 hypothetical protein [Rhodocyclaceae bacterium]